jgi:hypothetical protein
LQLYCSRLPISRVLFEGCTRDINNWEVPSSSMALPRGPSDAAEVPLARKRFSNWHLLSENPSSVMAGKILKDALTLSNVRFVGKKKVEIAGCRSKSVQHWTLFKLP